MKCYKIELFIDTAVEQHDLRSIIDAHLGDLKNKKLIDDYFFHVLGSETIE